MNRIQMRLLVMSLCACGALATAALSAAALPTRPSEGKGPETVWFQIYVVDIDDIDGPDQSFGANVYVRLRWKDERLAEKGKALRAIPLEDLWHPRVLIVNQTGRVQMSLPEEAHVDSGGTVTYHQRYVGRFSQPLQLSSFPRDTHEFTIHFIPAGYASDEVVFAPDDIPGSTRIVGGTIAETLSLPDWEILSFSAEARPYEIGDTDVHDPGFAFVFTAKRHLGYYIWQVILPLVLIVMMSWAAFWIDPSESGAQIGLAASSMLTLIAYRFVVANLVPRLPYMTRLDYFTLLSTLLVFLALIEVTVTSILSHSDHQELARTIDRRSRIVFPLVFALMLAGSFYG